MKIQIISGRWHIKLRFPTRFILSRFVLKRIKINNSNASLGGISSQDLRLIRKTVKNMRKVHGDWYLLDMKSADGDSVKIKL